MPPVTPLKAASNNPRPENAAAVAYAMQPDEPLFCFSPQALTDRANVFLNGFPGLVTFAVKSNPSEHVVRTLAKAGLTHWDVASVHEMKLVAGISPDAKFHYHNPVKSRREIEDAYKTYGCRRFVVDCREELQKIVDIVGPSDEIEIAVRFVLPRDRGSSAHDFSTKFGAPEHICVELLKKVVELGYRPMLTFHPGSQSRDPQTYVRHIEAAARIAKTADVKVFALNVGGGFPANYMLSTAPEPSVFFRIIDEAVAKFFGSNTPKLECEPGRGLVANCMSALTRVKLVCTDGDDIFINDGVYGALMEYMQAPELKPPFRVIRDGKVIHGPVKSWKVFGPTCDPLDVLPHNLDILEGLREGDYIEFGTLGAYGVSTLTKFNGYGEHDVVEVEKVFTV
ncbi:MAG: type III PLP-dependent enzyme [Alphaproteobacteria bacterium]|nr:type III PLP-dependent enzyme [Alphaproteobacteria bacterium]